MTEKLSQTIKEEIAQLPKEVQEAIRSFDWIKIAEQIGNGNQLDEEEIEDFQLETLLVLIGAVDPEFYAINIENHVNTTKEKAENIAREAFQKIYAPISNSIRENVKNSLKYKNPNWKQTVDFIISGGNYSAFIGESRLETHENQKPVNPPTLKDIKDQFVI